MKPKVTLVNFTPHPLETNWLLWEASKRDGELPMLDAAELAKWVDPAGTNAGGLPWVDDCVQGVDCPLCEDNEPHAHGPIRRMAISHNYSKVPRATSRWQQLPTQEQMAKLFWDVLRQSIPVAEHLNFVFMLEGVSVSFREQMVRHRIGTKVGDNIGVDIVPDQASSTWWSQSMRIQDMGAFADREMYRVPESLEGKTVPGWYGEDGYPDGAVPAADVFHKIMQNIQEGYNALVKAGVPMEDARELIPLGAQHRISWGLNLQSLLHILSKRGCWILQQGLWGPIIQGMVDELATKVHPMFRKIVSPPCIDADDKFTSCVYRLENARRVSGTDDHPICPLYLCRDSEGKDDLNHLADVAGTHIPHQSPDQCKEVLISSDSLVPRHREMKQRAEEYRKLWGADPYTWR